MNHVFISYSRNDTDFVTLLEEELALESHEVWLDTLSIRGGSEWEPEITKAINSAYAIIAVCSKHADESEWVKKELNIANKRNSSLQIIPVTIDETNLPIGLRRKQSIDFSTMYNGSQVDTIRNYRKSVRKLLFSLENARPLLRYLRDLKDPDDSVREIAAKKLGAIGEKQAAPELCKALGDLDLDVRYEAALALGKLGIYNTYKPLVRILHSDDDPDICAAAATALGNIGVIEAVTHLEAKLSHEDRFVRASVARALGKLKQIGSVAPLVTLLRTDGISTVRDAASIALKNIGGKEAKRALNRISQSDELN